MRLLVNIYKPSLQNNQYFKQYKYFLSILSNYLNFYGNECEIKYYLEKTFVATLDNHARKKIKMFEWNHKPHINKTLRKGIMKRSQLKNKVIKTKDSKDILNYKKQRHYVVKLSLSRSVLIV